MIDHKEQIKALIFALESALDWIDSVPSEIELPVMPGFDRDYIDTILDCARETRDSTLEQNSKTLIRTKPLS